MNPKNNFIYKLTDRLGTLDVFPLGENSFSIEYSRDDKDSNFEYKKSLNGKMTFVKEAFQRLMDMEDSMFRCEEQQIEIFKDCNGIEKSVFKGRISLNEAEFNIDKCFIVLKFMKDNKDQCFESGKSKQINLFPLIQDRIIVKTSSFISTFETLYCQTDVNPNNNSDLQYWCESGLPEDGNWTCIKIYQEEYRNNFYNETTWIREIIEVDCSEVPEPDWVFIEDNCGIGGKKKFAKKAEVYDCISDQVITYDQTGYDSDKYQTYYSCSILGYSGFKTEIDNGVLFKDFMIELLKSVCPDLILKSEFFQINPDVVSSINYVTNKRSTVDQIVVFQKSDVKRPKTSNNASKLEVTFSKVLEDLFKMFNVKWRISEGEFRIEHISYFSKQNGFDITTEALKKYFIGKNVYSYQSEKIPQKENFEFKESGGDFWNTEVLYSNCVSKDDKNEVKTIVENITTDVILAIKNPESDSKIVVDQGIFLISTKKEGDEYFINSANVPSGRRLNNVFSFKVLFKDYHYYNRPMKFGKVDEVLTEFLTTIPTKKGEKFAIPYSICEQEFNPDDIVKTKIGNGIVDSGSLRMKDSFIELDLIYESNQNIIQNKQPILTGGNFTTYKNEEVLIDVFPNDPDGTISEIQIVGNPSNGVVVINSINQIKYTPNADFVGFDYFTIRAKDNQSEYSANANFSVRIFPDNQIVVPKDDNFIVFHGETFSQPFSILKNDSGNINAVQMITTSVVTNQGVSITINESGFFDYSPPALFEGKDFFQYEFKDNYNVVYSANVFLNVTYKNRPIAVDYFFQILKNGSMVSDGSIGKEMLLQNVYSADGVAYAYTATLESKATAKGGVVVIEADGKFTYTPPTDFIGQDSFTYKVSNANGSATGTAFISVNEKIFVRLTTENLNIVGMEQSDFHTKKQDYVLNFFEDVDGLIPKDVSGLDFNVVVKENEIKKEDSIEVFNEDYIYFTFGIGSTSIKFLQNFEFYKKEKIGSVVHQHERNISIQTNETYQII